MSNITQVVNTEKSLSSFKKGVHTTGLDQVLSGTGPFTVFAPSDSAFNKLAEDQLKTLFSSENKGQLEVMLKHHIVEGKIAFKELKDGDKLKTMQGKDLVVKVHNAKVSIDGATIMARDLKSSNGVIHSLDTFFNN